MDDTLEQRLADCLHQAAADGLVDDDVAMVDGWLIVASTILTDGETGTLMTTSDGQTLPISLGLVDMADMIVRDAVRAWLDS